MKTRVIEIGVLPVLMAGLLIGSALFSLTHRYQAFPVPGEKGVVVLLDHWTGHETISLPGAFCESP